MSGILGLRDLDSRLSGMRTKLAPLMSAALEREARTIQDHVLSMLKDRSGTTRQVLSGPDAIKWTRDGDGNISGFEFGFVTKEGQKKAYYYLWVETGRESATKGGRRRAGKNRDGTIRYRKVMRKVSSIEPRRVFARAAVAAHDRMVVTRAALKTIAAIQDA